MAKKPKRVNRKKPKKDDLAMVDQSVRELIRPTLISYKKRAWARPKSAKKPMSPKWAKKKRFVDSTIKSPLDKYRPWEKKRKMSLKSGKKKKPSLKSKVTQRVAGAEKELFSIMEEAKEKFENVGRIERWNAKPEEKQQL